MHAALVMDEPAFIPVPLDTIRAACAYLEREVQSDLRIQMGDIARFGKRRKECQLRESGTSSALSPWWLASGRQMDQDLFTITGLRLDFARCQGGIKKKESIFAICW